MSLRLLAPVALLFFTACAFGQSADQELVSAVDSPDPVVPGQNITYTVTVRNNGPDAATNGGLNVNIGGGLTLISANSPAGFTCFTNGANASCINPSFPAATMATFTIVARVDASLLNFPDGTLTSNFFSSGTTVDPNNGNNSASATTSYDSPQIDLEIAVTDSPDPVGPDQNITFTGTIFNNGPNSAQTVNFNVVNNGSLRFQSANVAAGFNCTLPAVGGTPIFTCSAPTLAPGSWDFTVVLRADDDVLGINDGVVSTFFGVNGTGNDTNTTNNGETENTSYVTPDANLAVTVADLPDPALVGGTIEYLVTVTNAGPDAASNARLNAFNGGTLAFVSMEAPAGFNCVTPAVGAAPTMTCTNPSLAVGATAEFILTVRSDQSVVGEGGVVSTNFSVNSGFTDPNNSNNSETEDTTLIPSRIFGNGFEG